MTNENITARKNDLKGAIEHALKGVDCKIAEGGNAISIQIAKSSAICISVEEAGYCIYSFDAEWAEVTKYLCESEGDGDIVYFLDSIDECIGEIKRWVDFASKSISKPSSKPIINDGTLLSAFEALKDQYKELEFTNENAIGEYEDHAVYIYPKNADRHGAVMFEIWRKPTLGKFYLFIKKQYMTDEEYAESKRDYSKTSEKRGRITRAFASDKDAVEFVTSKLNSAKGK